jgi:hypothetical protein
MVKVRIFIKMVKDTQVENFEILLINKLFKGGWKNNLKHGKGAITFNDGSVFKGRNLGFLS